MACWEWGVQQLIRILQFWHFGCSKTIEHQIFGEVFADQNHHRNQQKPIHTVSRRSLDAMLSFLVVLVVDRGFEAHLGKRIIYSMYMCFHQIGRNY